MPTYFIVHATVADPAKRAAFDRWYEQEHVPDTVKTFGAERRGGSGARAIGRTPSTTASG